jgi:2-polyprenyl-3-methyl-5-hydroxy-6-metoxy-1,4-benzoquinol methylase
MSDFPTLSHIAQNNGIRTSRVDDNLFMKQMPGKRSFSKQWATYDYSDTTWGMDINAQSSYFLAQLGLTKEQLNGKLMLDAGCGNGKMTHWFADAGAEVIGLDFSSSVERAYAFKDNPRVHFVQGSVLEPPFSGRLFDIVFSLGVLHHTPDTRRAFEAVAALVKPGGRLCVWLYHPTLKKRLLIDPARNVVSRLPLPLQELAVWSCYLLYLVGIEPVRRTLRGKGRRTRTERLVPIRDWITPRYAYHHTPEEVAGWFRTLGFEQIRETTRITNGFSMIGLAAGPETA